MAISVRIPTPLRKLTHDLDTVQVEAGNIGELITALEQSYPGIQERLVDEAGNIRRFVNVFINDEDIRFLEEKATALKAGDEVSIVPAIAGG